MKEQLKICTHDVVNGITNNKQNQANYDDVTTQLYLGSFVVVVVNIVVVVVCCCCRLLLLSFVVVVVVNVVALLVVTDHIIFSCGQ